MPPAVRSLASAEAEVLLSVQAVTSAPIGTDTAVRVTTDAVQVPGGHGCAEDVPAARRLRMAEVPQRLEGTELAQRVVVGQALTP